MNGGYPVMGQFGGGQYCPVSENLGLAPHYSPGWYQSSAADPRFASRYMKQCNPSFNTKILFKYYRNLNVLKFILILQHLKFEFIAYSRYLQ